MYLVYDFANSLDQYAVVVRVLPVQEYGRDGVDEDL